MFAHSFNLKAIIILLLCIVVAIRVKADNERLIFRIFSAC